MVGPHGPDDARPASPTSLHESMGLHEMREQLIDAALAWEDLKVNPPAMLNILAHLGADGQSQPIAPKA